MHSDVPPDAAGSGVFGWLLAMLGQDVGFPVPRGGAQQLASSMQRRIVAGGGEVRTGARVTSVVLSGGRAVGVRLQDGTTVTARKAVLADVPAPALYDQLVGHDHLPATFVRDLAKFQWDYSTIKVNWALDRPVPWRADGARGAGTVHLGQDSDGLVDFAADLTVGRVPQRPFVLFGQMTTTDPTRSPEGTESAWAYTHVPRGVDWTREAVDAHVQRVEDAVERVAPGFGRRPWRGTSSRRRTCRRPTPTSSTARSTPARRACTSSCSCGRPRGSAGPRPRCPGSTSPAPRRTPAAACTAPAAGTPPGRRWPRRGVPASSRTRWSAPRGGGCSRTDRGPPPTRAHRRAPTGAHRRARRTATTAAPEPAASAAGTRRSQCRPHCPCTASPAGCGSSTLPGFGPIRCRDWPPQSHQRRRRGRRTRWRQGPEAEDDQRVGQAHRGLPARSLDRAHDGAGHLLGRVDRAAAAGRRGRGSCRPGGRPGCRRRRVTRG